jgi:7-cyano-7-deazaguanine synthase in queuosine biosynthesis
MIRVSYDFTAGNQTARTDLRIEADGIGRKSVFYEFSGPAAPQHAPTGEFAILAALPMAMRLGRPIRLAGTAERAFLANMEEMQQAWTRWRPDLFKPVPIEVSEETAPRLPAGQRTVTTFSGGLDSVFALHAHRRGLLGRRTLDIAGAVLIQGFDLPLDEEQRFETAQRSAKAILDHYDVPLTIVRTDWGRLSSPWGQTHMVGMASVLHQFARSFDCAMVAADMPYDGDVLGWGSNSMTNPLLGSVSFPVTSTGAGWSRAEKAGIVAAERPVLDHLRACTKSAEGANCGICEKCVRTKFDFLVNGVEEVPALGPPAEAESLRGLKITNGPQAYFWRDILDRGSWDQRPEMRAVIETMLESGYQPGNGTPQRRRRSPLRLWWKYMRA